MNMIDETLKEQVQRNTGTTSIRFDVFRTQQVVLQQQELNEVGDFSLASRISKRRRKPPNLVLSQRGQSHNASRNG